VPLVDTKIAKMNKAQEENVREAITVINNNMETMQKSASAQKFLASLDLDVGRNETMLWHGLPGPGARDAEGQVMYDDRITPLEAVKTYGFDDRLGDVSGMFGSGTYFADMSSRADQYAGRYNDDSETSVGTEASIFFARVTLGCPYLSTQSLEQLRRPPCIFDHFDTNLLYNDETVIGKPWHDKGLKHELCGHEHFDSVMAGLDIDGHSRPFREYIVYRNQCYPEFVVTYKRK